MPASLANTAIIFIAVVPYTHTYIYAFVCLQLSKESFTEHIHTEFFSTLFVLIECWQHLLALLAL